MRNLKNKKIYGTLLLFALLLSNLTAAADPGDLPGDGCDPFNPQDCNTPLDTWVYVLVAIALYFAYRHLQKQKTSLA